VVVGSEWFLLGAPWDSSGSGRGKVWAPGGLRDRVDLGDAATGISGDQRDETTGVRAPAGTVAAAHALAATLRTGMHDHPGRRPLVVGGDCSLLLGVFAQARPAFGEVGLWMVDGHPGFLDPRDSDTGETADSVLAVLTGDGPPDLVGLGAAVPMVAARHVALIGHRSTGLDAASAAELAQLPAGVSTLDSGAVARDPGGAGIRAAEWADGLRVSASPTSAQTWTWTAPQRPD
jgi:arginase